MGVEPENHPQIPTERVGLGDNMDNNIKGNSSLHDDGRSQPGMQVRKGASANELGEGRLGKWQTRQ